MTANFAALAAEFPPERISWRAAKMTRDGTKAMALAYIDARDVMDRLDEVLGIAGWTCEYRFSPDGSKTICRIGVRVQNPMTGAPEWVWKEDGAGDTDFEAEKGALSDAFKRAAVRLGIGRYLYDLGDVWVPCRKNPNTGKWAGWTDDPWKYVKAGVRKPSVSQTPPPPPDVPERGEAENPIPAEVRLPGMVPASSLEVVPVPENPAEWKLWMDAWKDDCREADTLQALLAVKRKNNNVLKVCKPRFSLYFEEAVEHYQDCERKLKEKMIDAA